MFSKGQQNNRNSYNQSSYNQNSYNQKSYNQNSYNQKSYNQNSYNQKSYNHNSDNVFARTSARGGRQGNQPQRRGNYDVSDVTAVVKKDVDEWRQSRCWPFSVYSPKLPGVIPDSYMDEGKCCALVGMKENILFS